MAAFTKLVIMRVFENLLSVKPLEKITVKDITDQCGISRNTFWKKYSNFFSRKMKKTRIIFVKRQ